MLDRNFVVLYFMEVGDLESILHHALWNFNNEHLVFQMIKLGIFPSTSIYFYVIVDATSKICMRIEGAWQLFIVLLVR